MHRSQPWLIVGKPANLAFFALWMDKFPGIFISCGRVQLQPTGPHPGTDLSQARQKAGDGVNCLWCKDNVQQHVAQIPVVTQTPPAV